MNQEARMREMLNADQLPPVTNYSWSGAGPAPALPSYENLMNSQPPEAASMPGAIQLANTGDTDVSFNIKAPDGKTYRVKGPAGTTPEEAAWTLKNHLDSQLPAGARPPTQKGLMEYPGFVKGLKEVGGGASTGAAMGVASLAGMLGDLENIGRTDIAGDQGARGLPTTADLLPWIQKTMYQPTTELGRDSQAGGAAAVTALSRNPFAIARSAAGGVLGQELAQEIPATKDINPDAMRAAGNLLIPTTGKVLGNVGGLVQGAAHFLDIPALAHLVAVMRKAGTALPSGAASTITQGTPVRRVLAVVLKPPANTQLSNMQGTTAGTIARFLWDFLGNPEAQNQANRLNVPYQ